MSKYSYSATTIVVAISLLVVTGCGGGGGGGAFDSTDTDGSPASFILIESDAPATSLTGPLLYLTGDTAVAGEQTIAGSGFGTLPLSFTTDTTNNTIMEQSVGVFTPDVVYDDLGRGIQLNLFSFSLAPIINIAYNEDNTIASTTQTTLAGVVMVVTNFIYEDGQLISRVAEAEDFTQTVTYNYSVDGTLVSADEVLALFSTIPQGPTTTYEFTLDSMDRVTGVLQFGIDGLLERDTTITYDSNGNITELVDSTDTLSGFEAVETSSYSYTASTEPTVNIFGLLSALNASFIPVLDNVGVGITGDE